MLRTLARSILLLGLLAQPSAAQFLPPGIVNGNAPFDSGADVHVDHVIDADGRIHAVWASQVPLVTGAGNDPDIYYAVLIDGVWSQPELVNSYGRNDNSTAHDERFPRLLVSGGIERTVVWQSTFPLAGAGADWDIIASDFDGTSWTTRLVNDAVADNAVAVEDTQPTIVQFDLRPLVAWQRTVPAGPSAIFEAERFTDWSTPTQLSRHPIGAFGDDFGPVALARSGDTVYAAWSSDNPNIGIGNDRDIVFATRTEGADWTEATPVSNLALNDSGEDRDPTIALVHVADGDELHVAWSSNEDLPVAGGSAGTDRDIFATVVPRFRLLPPVNPTFIVNDLALTDSADDVRPSLCAEPGGVVHIAWQTEDSFVGDDDVLTSTNVTAGDGWEPFGLLGLNGLLDGPADDDQRPDLECGREGLLSGAWQSTDPLFGLVGSDFDIFHALGQGRTIGRPEPVNADAPFDGFEDERPDFAIDRTGVRHAVWTRRQGGDEDIYYAHSGGPLGWSDPIAVNPWFAGDAAVDDRARVTVDDAGRVYVVWDSNFDFRGQTGSDFDIYLRVLDGGTWSVVELVDSRATQDNGDLLPDDAFAHLAVNASGMLEVLWGSGADLSGIPFGVLEWIEKSTKSNRAGTRAALQLTAFPVNLPQVDFVAGPDGFSHLAFASAEGDGPGIDSGIFYSTGGGNGWLAPQPVIAGGTSDGANDLSPALLVSEFGVTVLWESDREPGSSGPDRDLWASRRAGAFGWTVPALFHALMASDSADDDLPAADARGDYRIVGWRFEDVGQPGQDSDLAVVAFNGEPSFPLESRIFLANGNGVLDTLDNQFIGVVAEGQLLADSVGYVIWHDADDLGSTIGTDADILSARLSLFLQPELIFRNGFDLVPLPWPAKEGSP